MTIEGVLEEEEFVRLNRRLFYRRPIIGVLHLLILGLGLFWSTREGVEAYRTLLLGSPVVIAAALYFMISHKSKLQFRKSKTLQSRIRYPLREDGLLLETSDASAKMPWSQVSDIQDTRDHLVIYSSKGQAYVVGKAWFSGPESMNTFYKQVERQFAPRPIEKED